MKNFKIKTIDIQAKEWFDKVNGNSYFASLVTLNFGLKNEMEIKVPFQYGYGDSAKHRSLEQLEKEGFLPKGTTTNREYFENNKIVVRYSKRDNCKKADLKNI